MPALESTPVRNLIPNTTVFSTVSSAIGNAVSAFTSPPHTRSGANYSATDIIPPNL